MLGIPDTVKKIAGSAALVTSITLFTATTLNSRTEHSVGELFLTAVVAISALLFVLYQWSINASETHAAERKVKLAAFHHSTAWWARLSLFILAGLAAAVFAGLSVTVLAAPLFRDPVGPGDDMGATLAGQCQILEITPVQNSVGEEFFLNLRCTPEPPLIANINTTNQNDTPSTGQDRPRRTLSTLL